MGFPMFNPIYVPGTELKITGPVTMENDSLKSIIENQLSYNYWPVRVDELAAKIEYNQIKETTLNLGDALTVTSKFLSHPIFCFGYRVDYKGKSVATVYDHELFRNLFTAGSESSSLDKQTAQEGEIAAAEENEKVRQFLKGADIVVHDAQYTQEEYPSRVGWGHCSFDHAVEATANIGIKKLVFFHHDPARTDSQLEQIEKGFTQNAEPQVLMAREGLLLEA